MTTSSDKMGRKPDHSAPAHVEHLEIGINLLFYIRSSSDEQEMSPPQQAEEDSIACRAWGVLDEGDTIPASHRPDQGVYADPGVSGWKYDLDERPGSLELLEYCEANPQPADRPGLIVVWSLARFGRFPEGPEQAIYWLFRLRRSGWRVRSLTQPGLDSDDRDRLSRVIRVALESEKDTAASEERSAEVKRANQKQLKTGTWRGGSAPFGYQRVAVRLQDGEVEVLEVLEPGKRNGYTKADTSLKPHPVEQSHLLRAFQLYARGDEHGQEMSLAAVARRLNEADVYPQRAGGKGFYHTTVKKLLTNDVYLGVQRDEEGESHKALWEPIVPRDLWIEVQQKLDRNSKRRGKQNSVYMLSGVLFCAACGRRYHGTKDAERDLFYYRTKQAENVTEPCETCSYRVRIEDIEIPLIEMLSEIHEHPKVTSAIQAELEARKQGGEGLRAQRAALEADLHEVVQKIDRLVDLVDAGGRVGESVQDKVEELNRRYETLEGEIAEIDQMMKGDGPAGGFAETVASLHESLDAASGAERKQLVQALVARVELDQTQETATAHIRKPGRGACVGS